MEQIEGPKGIPSVTYVRVMPSKSELATGIIQNDLVAEGNTITVVEPGQPSTRHEVANV